MKPVLMAIHMLHFTWLNHRLKKHCSPTCPESCDHIILDFLQNNRTCRTLTYSYCWVHISTWLGLSIMHKTLNWTCSHSLAYMRACTKSHLVNCVEPASLPCTLMSCSSCIQATASTFMDDHFLKASVLVLGVGGDTVNCTDRELRLEIRPSLSLFSKVKGQ